MNRYYYYLIILNMLINVFMFVPSVLIRERFDGSVLAILIGVLIGSVFLYIFSYALNRFPEKGLPEILAKSPKWFSILFLSFFAVMWFGAGSVSLISFNNVLIRFVNPDISGLNMISVFCIFVVVLLARLKTDKVLYALEIVLVLNLPLIATVVVQAYTNDYLTIRSIMEVGTHVYDFPSFSALSAATFVFSGYANMVVFNRVFTERINLKRLWFIPIIGLLNLVTSIFIPIGMWGADGVGDLLFPWISTADTLRIEFGPIERVITLFILLYVSISMISVIIHWHVALSILRSLVNTEKYNRKKRLIIDYAFLLSFSAVLIFLEYNFREQDIFNFGELWLNIRFPSEAILVLLIYILARRKRNEA